MLHAIFAKIVLPAGFEHGEGSLPLFGQPRQHHFPIIEQQGIERNRCLDAHAAPGHQRHRNVKSFRQRHRDRQAFG